jgi:acyl carrier protein
MPFNKSDIGQTLRQYIQDDILEDDSEIDPEENLLTETGIDSLAMLRLVGFIETHYEVKVSPVFFTIDNFRNLNAISDFVHKLIVELKN